MYPQVNHNQRTKRYESCEGKIFPIFIPYTELWLIDEIDIQAHQNLENRSKYARGVFKKLKKERLEQEAEVQSLRTVL